jgi:hypothetical protein
MVGPTEEFSQIGVPVPSQGKEGTQGVKRTFTSPPSVPEKGVEVSKTVSAEVTQVTGVKTSPQEAAKIEQKTAAHAIKKAKEKVLGKLEKGDAEIEKLRKKIFGG